MDSQDNNFRRWGGPFISPDIGYNMGQALLGESGTINVTTQCCTSTSLILVSWASVPGSGSIYTTPSLGSFAISSSSGSTDANLPINWLIMYS